MTFKTTFIKKLLLAICVMSIAKSAFAAAAAQLAWNRVLSSSDLDAAGRVATDATGNAYVVGTTYGNLFGPLQNDENAFLAKYGPT